MLMPFTIDEWKKSKIISLLMLGNHHVNKWTEGRREGKKRETMWDVEGEFRCGMKDTFPAIILLTTTERMNKRTNEHARAITMDKMDKEKWPKALCVYVKKGFGVLTLLRYGISVTNPLLSTFQKQLQPLTRD
ncbi:CLUMA_CG010492, isoform A [Clunio marinus]|uniref:CLUMA_CG010492, isoform A n=1 Tax=Clunio marinus TaxID=568069 RepID=A0A1J1IBX3_9DIPT|nr:CLUMA_CG010492, isoform A [Clunio marinus]